MPRGARRDALARLPVCRLRTLHSDDVCEIVLVGEFFWIITQLILSLLPAGLSVLLKGLGRFDLQVLVTGLEELREPFW